jgi:hypothetical protein
MRCGINLDTPFTNRRLQQNEIPARLSRIEPDDRAPLRCEGKTFRLAIQITQLPGIEKRSGSLRRGDR